MFGNKYLDKSIHIGINEDDIYLTPYIMVSKYKKHFEITIGILCLFIYICYTIDDLENM